ncbi:GNAT family N-acetyltransferase [Oceanirhabdus seepicola]|uniref:N-acetyltransferase n=1 Tax=Oceanirhabdus seepicola TaxID=2828781 RepID=A0A9J6P5V5_9CLOT|nr:GNAT family N-acetyltransferase [Oceanirhabdus seepicola]MCM1991505.1 N-acetyltransferase [Oceanirhabdus seepicola]
MCTCNYIIRKIKVDDKPAILDIFNYYVENSMAAYSEKPVNEEYFFHGIKESWFYVVEIEQKIAGFAFLRPFRATPTSSHVAQIGYFIDSKCTHKGLGKKLLDTLFKIAGADGITEILAHVSSLNTPSLNFHKKQGFNECGRFKNVIIKNGIPIDMVWFQKSVK